MYTKYLNFSFIKEKAIEFLKNKKLQSIALITFLMLFSRFLGMVRGFVIYQKMDTAASDLLFSALGIPEIISTLLILGTILNSVLPVASRLKETAKPKLLPYFSFITLSISLLVILISILFLIFIEPILKIYTSPQVWQTWFEKGLLDDYFNVTRILMISPLVFALQSVFGAFLLMEKKFLTQALAGIIYNFGMLFGILLAPISLNFYGAAFGMVAGSVLATLVYYIVLYKDGFILNFRPKFLLDNYQPLVLEIKNTWLVMLPRMLTFNGVIAANLIIKNVADNTAGQITAFDLALSVQGAFMVVITSIASVFFPDLAKIFNDKSDNKNFWRKLVLYTEGVAWISLFGALVTFLVSPVLLWLYELFGKGQGSADYIVYLARVATLSFVFQSVSEILSKYFYVTESKYRPILISTISLVIQIIFIYQVVGYGLDAGFVVAASLLFNYLCYTLLSIYFIRVDYKKLTS